MVKTEKDVSSSSQMDINKIFLEAVSKLKKSEVSVSKIRAYILRHHDIDILHKLKDLKMQTRNAMVPSQNSKKGAVSTIPSKAKTEVLKTINFLKQSKLQDKAKPNDKIKDQKRVEKASQKEVSTKVKVIATVSSQNSKKGVVSTMPTKAKTGGLKTVKDVKEVKKLSKLEDKAQSNDKTKVKIEVGTSSKDKKSSAMKVEKVLKVKESIKSEVPEKKLISVSETKPEDKKNVVEYEVGTSSMDRKSSVLKLKKVIKVKESIKSKVPEKKLISIPDTKPEDKKEGVESQVGTSSKDKKSSVVKVEKVPKVKKSIKNKVPEEKPISVSETIPEDKKDGDAKAQKSTNENAREKDIDSKEIQQENDGQMEVE